MNRLTRNPRSHLSVRVEYIPKTNEAAPLLERPLPVRLRLRLELGGFGVDT